LSAAESIAPGAALSKCDDLRFRSGKKKRGILRSVKDPQHGRFDLWEIAV
jgi:hypothetical protein